MALKNKKKESCNFCAASVGMLFNCELCKGKTCAGCLEVCDACNKTVCAKCDSSLGLPGYSCVNCNKNNTNVAEP